MSVVVDRNVWAGAPVWYVYMVNADGVRVSLQGWPHFSEAHALAEAQALAYQYGVKVKAV
jgi:hypothetical protein